MKAGVVERLAMAVQLHEIHAFILEELIIVGILDLSGFRGSDSMK